MAEMEEEKRLAGEIAKILDECRLSNAVHPRKLKELAALRRSSSLPSCGGRFFFPAFARALTPLFDFPRRTLGAERVVRFVSAFASRSDEKDNVAACDAFLEEFLRFLLAAAAVAHRPARFRACQVISEIIMRLPDDAEVSNEVWDEVIDSMKERMRDKVPAIRAFAVRALSRFANDVEDNDIINFYLEALPQEQNAEVRRTILFSLPPSSTTAEAIVDSTLDVSESVRKAAYVVLANKFPLQSLSIKLRTIILQRGLSDRSSSVSKECLKMLKDEWLTKCCKGDPVALLRFLDVETYESVGETVIEALLKVGMVRIQEDQSLRRYLAPQKSDGHDNFSIELMEAEDALYWKMLCRHLHTEAQVKGTDAAATTGTEAAVYASEASDNNDLLEGILPVTVSDYVNLVKMHLSAGPNYRFTSRQLLLLGAMHDFSDTSNRKVASSFIHELLVRGLEFEVDDDGNKILIGDGVSLGGDRDWAKAVADLAKKVHASAGEFEVVITSTLEELAQPCRERTADFLQWMHCLAVTGLLLENIHSLSSLHGKAIEPSELLHSILLPGAKQSHTDIQRAATRCLGLFGLLERRAAREIVKQLQLSFMHGPNPVRIMATKSLIDLVTWHGPQEVDAATGTEILLTNNEKQGFTPVNLSNLDDDNTKVGALDLLYYGLKSEDWAAIGEAEDNESVHSILGEGFAKILLLSENYPYISTSLHPLIVQRLINLYFTDEIKELERLRQCLCVFFEHYPALSHTHKKCVSMAFVPVMRSMWPGIYGNPSGSTVTVSKMRKLAIKVSHFMLQMMQTPLFVKEDKEEESSELSSGSLSDSSNSTNDFASGEEGLAIRIAAEVISCSEKKTAAGKSYISALCRVAALTQFRSSEQEAIRCMRGLLNGMTSLALTDKEVVKELSGMVERLRSLDQQTDEELSQDLISATLGKLGLEVNLNVDSSKAPQTTPAMKSARTAPVRRRVRREASSSEDDEGALMSEVPMTPSIVTVRSQRASKTAAMNRIATATKSAVRYTENDEDGQSDMTTDETSDEDSDENDE